MVIVNTSIISNGPIKLKSHTVSRPDWPDFCDGNCGKLLVTFFG